MEVVAHRAGNTPETAARAQGLFDMIELDVHVLRSRVEVRHAKVLHPTTRLWDKWQLLPRSCEGVEIEEVLAALEGSTPLMVDLKCFRRRSARRIRDALPAETPVIASTRNWWVLSTFRDRPQTRRLRSCGARWQVWWASRWVRFSPGDGVCVHERFLTPSVLARLHRRTSLVFSWGATGRARIEELAHAGLTGVIVDDGIGPWPADLAGADRSLLRPELR